MIDTWEIENSSQLTKVVYDDVIQELTVTFVKGSIYKYANVPYNVFEALLDAESTGSYFNLHIAKKFQFQKENQNG